MTSEYRAGVSGREARHHDAVDRAATAGRAALEATVLRLRSVEALDVALALATAGREPHYASWSFRSRMEQGVEPQGAPRLEPPWAATLAQILARSQLDHVGDEIALAIYVELAERAGLAALGPRDAQVYCQLLLEAGEYEQLRAVLPVVELRTEIRDMLVTDLTREDARSGKLEPNDWLVALGRLMRLEAPGFELVDATEPFRFDAIRNLAAPASVDGPLVTVIVPSYAPEAGLLTAVRSILNQTWGNLEVLIVDDESPDETRVWYEAALELDDRVRLISKPRNAGTYAARNTALALARGVFVTGQDADDWSHPRRIERQAVPLLQEPALVASLSRCLRVTDDLRTSSLQASGSSPIRVNSSSLLFRRTEVIHKVGYYDLVRKAADSEYIFRLRAVFGATAVRELTDCLALVRLVGHSLSRADFLPGWQHEARVWYRDLYTYWHRGLRSGTPHVAIEPRARHFPAPVGVLSRPAEPLHIDDVFVADLRDLAESQELLLAEARLRLAAGRRVGLAHLERFSTLEQERRPLHPTILAAVSRSEFALVEWSREVSADHVVFWPADLPEFHGPRGSGWRVKHATLVVETHVPFAGILPAFARWQDCADWVAGNLHVEHDVRFAVPVRDEPALPGRRADGVSHLQDAGSCRPGLTSRDCIITTTPARSAAAHRLAALLEASNVQGVAVRVVEGRPAVVASGASASSASSRPLPHEEKTERRQHRLPLVGPVPANVESSSEQRQARGDALVFTLHSERDEVSVRLSGFGQPAGSGVFDAVPPVSSRPLPRGEAQKSGKSTPGIDVLPFVAVAGSLGDIEIPAWQSSAVEGVEYWFSEAGFSSVVWLGAAHRLRRPVCAVVVRSARAADTGEDVSPQDLPTRIADTGRVVRSLRCELGAAAVAVQDSHIWSLHAQAPNDTVWRKDHSGRIRAVATDGAIMAAFLSALRDAVQCEQVEVAAVAGNLISGKTFVAPPRSASKHVRCWSTLSGDELVPTWALEDVLVP